MRANATLLFFLYLLGVFTWRQLSKAPRVQRAIHGACLGPALQWYTLLLAGCAAMLGRTLSEFFGSYYGLGSLDVMDNLERSWAVSADHLPNVTFVEFQAHLSMPPPLKHFSMLSILAGVPVLVVAAGHIFVKFAHPGMRIVQAMGSKEASGTPWWPAPRLNRLITLLIMPAMLSVMSMRGSCRIWALTTGQAHNHFQTSFDRVEKWEMALYRMDQEVGQLFQFVSVYAFCRICSSFLNEVLGGVTCGNNNSELVDVAKEFRKLVRYAGFLAVWAFILVGALRCLLEFFVEESHYYEFMEGSLSLLEQSVLKPANTVFSFLTLMCVANMFIVGRTRTIKERLGNANLKFMGARLLLLVIAVQEQAAQALTSDSELHKKVAAKAADRGLDISALGLTELQADLLHLSLLNFECLFVVAFNVFAWRDLDLETTGVADYGYSNLCADEEAPCADEGAAEETTPAKGLVGALSFAFRPQEGAPLLLGAEVSGQRKPS